MVDTARTAASRDGSNDESSVSRGVGTVGRFCRGVAFWMAVTLPVLHVPLFLRGLGSSEGMVAFGVLVGANLLALRLGHGYALQGE